MQEQKSQNVEIELLNPVATKVVLDVTPTEAAKNSDSQPAGSSLAEPTSTGKNTTQTEATLSAAAAKK
jgi:hypothetical protein